MKLASVGYQYQYPAVALHIAAKKTKPIPRGGKAVPCLTHGGVGRAHSSRRQRQGRSRSSPMCPMTRRGCILSWRCTRYAVSSFPYTRARSHAASLHADRYNQNFTFSSIKRKSNSFFYDKSPKSPCVCYKSFYRFCYTTVVNDRCILWATVANM